MCYKMYIYSLPRVGMCNILISDVHFLFLPLSLLHNAQRLIKDSTDEQRKYIHLQRFIICKISLSCNTGVSYRSQIQSELRKIFMKLYSSAFSEVCSLYSAALVFLVTASVNLQQYPLHVLQSDMQDNYGPAAYM
jgi:hypothetical protein